MLASTNSMQQDQLVNSQQQVFPSSDICQKIVCLILLSYTEYYIFHLVSIREQLRTETGVTQVPVDVFVLLRNHCMLSIYFIMGNWITLDIFCHGVAGQQLTLIHRASPFKVVSISIRQIQFDMIALITFLIVMIQH